MSIELDALNIPYGSITEKLCEFVHFTETNNIISFYNSKLYLGKKFFFFFFENLNYKTHSNPLQWLYNNQ